MGGNWASESDLATEIASLRFFKQKNWHWAGGPVGAND
jgi:hypothetical protein